MVRIAVVFGVVLLLACSQSGGTQSADSPFTSQTANVATANGAYAMAVCKNPTGTTAIDCQGGTVSSLATLAGVLTPPILAWDATATVGVPDTFPHVQSWALGRPINFSSYETTASLGVFFDSSAAEDADDRTLLPGGATGAPTHFAKVFTGYVIIPAAGTKTFAMGSDSGGALGVQTCPYNDGSCTATSILTIDDTTSGHQMTYKTLAVTFPAAGTYPFVAATFNNAGESGFELGWADGDTHTTLPTLAPANAQGYALVPNASINAPDVRAVLAASASGPILATSAITYTATITNEGPGDAWPTGSTLATAGAGLTYTLALPITVFPTTGAIGTVKVNGSTVTPTLATNTANLLVTVPIKTSGTNPNNLLIAGGTPVTVSVVATVRSSGAPANGTPFNAQARITGHATDPRILINGSSALFGPPATLYVYTNDPTTSDNTTNSGNAPADLLAHTPESSPTTDVTIIDSVGDDDDDALVLIMNQPVTGDPVFTPTPATVSSINKTNLAGTITGPNPAAVRVQLTTVPAGFGQSNCTAAAGQWVWDASANVCTCFTASAANAWICTSIGLVDCPAPGNCYTATAQAGDTTGQTVGNPATYSFRVVAPVVTITAPVSGTTNVRSQSVTGTLTDGLGNNLSGKTVTVTATGPGNVSCSGPTNGSGAWSCTLPLNADGAWSMVASVPEANGGTASSATVNLSVNTANPTLDANVPNAAKTFNVANNPGTVSGNCATGQSVAATINTSTNRFCTATCAAGRWSCAISFPNPTATQTGRTINVVETATDSTTLSGSTGGFIVDITPPAAPAYVLSSTLIGAPGTPPTASCSSGCGANESGASVTVTLSTASTPISTCTTTVAGNGSWSCSAWSNTTLSPDGPYTSTAVQTDNHGNPSAGTDIAFQVRTQPPATPSLALTPSQLFGSASANPPAISGGNGGTGNTLTVTITGGTARTCTNVLSSNGVWSCASWSPATALPDGTYTVTAKQNDGFNDSTVSTQTIIIDTVPPGTPVVSIAGLDPGGFTRNASPTFTAIAGTAGDARPQTVTITLTDGTTCGPLPSSGALTCAPASPFADGVQGASATQTDAAGNTSTAGSFSLNIKTHTATPLVVSPGEGTTLSGAITLNGTAEAGASVVVTVDATALPAATANGSGNFAVNAGFLTTGGHTATAVSTDFLGNTSTSTTRHFTVGIGGHVEGSSLGCSSAGSPAAAAWTLLLPLLAMFLRKRRAALAAAALVATGTAARADDVALDHFRPASGSDGTIGVEGARPPAEGDQLLELRLWGVGQSRPLVFVPDNGGASTALIRNRVGGWLGAQLHVAGPLSLALQLPFLLGQHGDFSALPPNLGGGGTLGGGIGDLRATARVGLLRQETAFVDVAAQASVELPTAKSGNYLGDDSVHGEALAALGRRLELGGRSAIDLIGNLYLRLRPTRQVLDVQAGNELGMRAALAWLPGANSPLAPDRVILEVEGASFLHAAFANGTVPAEWRGGLEYCVGPVALDVGAGGGLAKGIGTPGLRLLGGVALAPAACGNQSVARIAPRPSIAPIATPQPPAPKLAPPSVIAQKPVPAVEKSPAADKPPAVAQKPAPPPAQPAAPPAVAPAKPTVLALPLPAPPPATTSKPPAVPAKTVEPPPLPLPAPAAKTEQPALALPGLPLPPATAPAASKKNGKRVAQAETTPAPPGLDALPLALPATSQASIDGNLIKLTREPQFSRNQLRSSSHAVLDDVARLLSDHAEIGLVTILAPERAQGEAVAAYLRSKGVSAGRLQVSSEPALVVELRITRR